MKINLKLSIIGSTIAAMVAFCGTSQAASVFNVSGWSTQAYGSGGWTISEGTTAGTFSIGGGTLTGASSWGAQFPDSPLSFNGNYIELTGTASFTGYVGGTGPLRFGIFNANGQFGTGTGWTGYMFAPPTGSGVPGGAGEFSGHVGQSYASTYSGYGFGTPDAYNAGTTNGIGNDTFTFAIKLQRLSATSIRMSTSFIGSTNSILYSVDNFPFGNIDAGGAATANNVYNAVGFYLASNGTATTSIDFSNVQITYVPEPASMALLGSGLLGLLMVRRFRKK